MRDLVLANVPEISAAAARRSDFTREIVEAATSVRSANSWRSAVRCIGRVGRKACGTRIRVGRPDASRVEWTCEKCGERGVVTGFEGTELDMTPYVPSKKLHMWGFDDEERALLLEATTSIPPLRAVVSRASPAADVDGLLILQATVDELDDVYTLVEHLTDATRSRRRILLLDGMRASLCTAIDGF